MLLSYSHQGNLTQSDTKIIVSVNFTAGMSLTLSVFLAKSMSQRLATKYPYYTRQTSNYILFSYQLCSHHQQLGHLCR